MREAGEAIHGPRFRVSAAKAGATIQGSRGPPVVNDRSAPVESSLSESGQCDRTRSWPSPCLEEAAERERFCVIGDPASSAVSSGNRARGSISGQHQLEAAMAVLESEPSPEASASARVALEVS
jgi:hypothetical protein